MVSEDFHEGVSRLLSIHLTCKFRELSHAMQGKMVIVFHKIHTLSEFCEIFPFRSLELMDAKEGDYDLQQIFSSSNRKTVQMFSVVIISGIQIDVTDSEERSYFFQ